MHQAWNRNKLLSVAGGGNRPRLGSTVVSSCISPLDIMHTARFAEACGVSLQIAYSTPPQVVDNLRIGPDWFECTRFRAGKVGAIIADISALRDLHIDKEGRTAIIGAGATTREIVRASARQGLSLPPTPGNMTGLAYLIATGGFHGLLEASPSPLAHCTEVQVVSRNSIDDLPVTDIADILESVALCNGDLGIVSSYRVRLAGLTETNSGLVVFPFSKLPCLLKKFLEILASAPPRFSLTLGILKDSKGDVVVLLEYSHHDNHPRGLKTLFELQDLAAPAMTIGGAAGGLAALAIHESLIPKEQRYDHHHYEIKSPTLSKLTGLMASSASMPPSSTILINGSSTCMTERGVNGQRNHGSEIHFSGDFIYPRGGGLPQSSNASGMTIGRRHPPAANSAHVDPQ